VPASKGRSMTLRLAVLSACLALPLSAAAAGPVDVVPGSLGLASRDDPHAGRPFAGYVLVLPAAARRSLVSVDATCPATVLGRAVTGRATRVPAGDPLPAVLVCTWSIPRDRVGWTFRARMDLDLERRVRGGGVELETVEGRTTAWVIQP
jgi:hypothetical protein